MDSKLNPLQMVAREMAPHSTMTRGQIESALSAVLDHLMLRADSEIRADSKSESAVSLARQYQAVSEAILLLGSQLIAFDDIEAEDDVDDEWSPKN